MSLSGVVVPACLLCQFAVAVPTDKRPNVLMFAIDDLRANFGKSYDEPEAQTPHIDAFAVSNGSVTFSRAFCQAATCGVSRSSLLTGRRPDTTHVLTNGACPFTTGNYSGLVYPLVLAMFNC